MVIKRLRCATGYSSKEMLFFISCLLACCLLFVLHFLLSFPFFFLFPLFPLSLFSAFLRLLVRLFLPFNYFLSPFLSFSLCFSVFYPCFRFLFLNFFFLWSFLPSFIISFISVAFSLFPFPSTCVCLFPRLSICSPLSFLHSFLHSILPSPFSFRVSCFALVLFIGVYAPCHIKHAFRVYFFFNIIYLFFSFHFQTAVHSVTSFARVMQIASFLFLICELLKITL